MIKTEQLLGVSGCRAAHGGVPPEPSVLDPVGPKYSEARTETLFCSLPPGHRLPGRSRQTVRQLFDGHRPMAAVSS